jgi:hypothetical protein
MFLLHSGNADLIRHAGDGLRMILHRAGAGQILAEVLCLVRHLPLGCRGDGALIDGDPAAPDLPSAAAGAPASRNTGREVWLGVQIARLRAEIRSLSRVVDRLYAWLGEGNRLPEKGRGRKWPPNLALRERRSIANCRAAARGAEEHDLAGSGLIPRMCVGIQLGRLIRTETILRPRSAVHTSSHGLGRPEKSSRRKSATLSSTRSAVLLYRRRLSRGRAPPATLL